MLLLIVVVALTASVASGEEEFPVVMPSVSPRLPRGESYLCTGVRIEEDTEIFITGIEPLVQMETAHHLLLIGCSDDTLGGHSNGKNLWNCGGSLGEEGLAYAPPCHLDSTQQMLYMWSGNASGVRFPPGSGMSVGRGSSVRLLVLQVHYTNASLHGDTSGVSLSYSLGRPRLHVGILGLHVHDVVLPHATAHWDVACQLPVGEEDEVTPFAFLAHTHKRGVWASGWVVRGTEWSLIGAADPQLPQSFFPVSSNLTLSPGDVLAARCVMVALDEDERIVKQGLRKDMEMCDYFVLYTTKSESLMKRHSCTSKKGFSWEGKGMGNIPRMASKETP